MRRFASLSLCATVAISDSINRPVCGLASAIIGSAWSTAKLVSGALAATLVGELQRLGQAAAGFGQILRKAVGRAFGRGIDAAGEHHVRHARQRRSAAAAAPIRRRRRRCRAGLRAARNRPRARRRGYARRRQAPARRRSRRPSAPRSRARGCTGCGRTPGATSANAAGRSVASWSVSSDRSRPEEKWSPMPWMTTAPMSSGRVAKQSPISRMMPSLSALRLAGRFRPTVRTAPSCSILSSPDWPAACGGVGVSHGLIASCSE